MNAPSIATRLSLYVIYYDPLDYPGEYVVRRWELLEPKEVLGRGKTLREVRQMLPPRLMNIGRQSADESQIVEVWL